MAPDPDDPERRILATSKNNLAAHPPSLAFRLVGDGPTGAAHVEWLGESEHGASALLAIPADEGERGALDEAADVLRTILGDGPVAAREAEREARQAGITDATLRRARKAAGVVAERVGGLGSAGRWEWRLSAKALTETLRHSYPDGEHLRPSVSALAAPDAELRHTCGRCQEYADDAELTIDGGRHVHRQPCEATA